MLSITPRQPAPASIRVVAASGATFYAECSDSTDGAALKRPKLLPKLTGDVEAWEDYTRPPHFQCAGPWSHIVERLNAWLAE